MLLKVERKLYTACTDCGVTNVIHIYYSLSTGKYHESVASIVTSAVGTNDNAAPDE